MLISATGWSGRLSHQRPRAHGSRQILRITPEMRLHVELQSRDETEAPSRVLRLWPFEESVNLFLTRVKGTRANASCTLEILQMITSIDR
jgi:hypothetical protein